MRKPSTICKLLLLALMSWPLTAFDSEALPLPACALQKPVPASAALCLSLDSLQTEASSIRREILCNSAGDCPADNFELVLIDYAIPNAWMLGGHRLVLSSALAQYLDSPAASAFVFAHEISHHLLGHGDHQSPLGDEFAADSMALAILARQGYSLEGPAELLQKIALSTRETGMPLGELYPSLGARLERL